MKSKIKFLIFLIYLTTLNALKEDLEIQINNTGAELMSIKYKGKEYLHDETEFWEGKSPILFPIVGRLKNGKTIINGKEYEMSTHGFAHGMTFEKIGDYSYKLESNEETLKQYPFNFELYVSYKIEGNKLSVDYKVVNTDTQTILFGIGGHPGFKCNYFEEKTQIEFENEEDNIKIIPVILPEALMSNETEDGTKILTNKKILEIKKNSFENDAIVFTDIKSKSVTLFDNGKKILKFNFEQFKYLGIWSAKGEAPFICLEPWYDPPDYINSNQKFEEKKDIVKLDANETFTVGFSVEFYGDEPNGSMKFNYNSIFGIIYLMLILF